MRYPETTAPIPAPAPVRGAEPMFSAGSVVARSFSVWNRNLVPFSVVTLTVHLPLIVLGLLVTEDEARRAAIDRFLWPLAGFVVTGALTHGVLDSLSGRPVSLRALFSSGFRRLGWVVAVSVLVGVGLFVGLVILVVPGIVWYCALYVAVPVVVAERGSGWTDAFARSRALTKDHRWAVFVIACTFLVLLVVTGGVVFALLPVIGDLPAWLSSLAVDLVAAFVSAVGACAPAVAYHDLRVAKEGVTTEQLAKVFE